MSILIFVFELNHILWISDPKWNRFSRNGVFRKFSLRLNKYFFQILSPDNIFIFSIWIVFMSMSIFQFGLNNISRILDPKWGGFGGNEVFDKFLMGLVHKFFSNIESEQYIDILTYLCPYQYLNLYQNIFHEFWTRNGSDLAETCLSANSPSG